MVNTSQNHANSSDKNLRKQAEVNLEKANEIFALLVDAVEDYAIFAMDLDGTILTWNSGGKRLKGYSAYEAIGRNFSIFYSKEDVERNHPQEELKLAAKNGKYEEEGWRLKKDGSRFWANIVITALRDSTGSLCGFGKVTRDLTERRNAELALRKSEERFRSMVEDVQDYAIFMLDPEGNVSSWNLGAERSKGYTAKEIIGRHFSTFYPAEDIQNGKPKFELEQALAKGRFEDEGWRVAKNGTKFWANVIITPIYANAKTLLGFSKVTRNLNERKLTEDKLKTAFTDLEQRVQARTLDLTRAKARAEEAIIARDRFFSMASHELKTPLSSLKMQAQLRKRSVLRGDLSDFLPENLIALCDNDERQINRLSQLVENMLDISKLTSGAYQLETENFKLRDLINEVVKLLGPNLEESKNICRIECPDNLTGTWDKTRLGQVFTNLLSNCSKYAAGSPIEIVATEGKKAVTIEVKDSGPGIQKDKQLKIFNPFERANVNEATGLGLGLYIIRQIIEAHGGDIQLKSNPGEGTAFTIHLPKVLPVRSEKH